MADMHTPLKPCPFCSGPARHKLIETYSTDSSYFVVGCNQCGAEIPADDKLSAADIAAWNRRAPSQDAEIIKALREALEAIDSLEVMEINPSNYDHEIVCELNNNAVQASLIARAALAGSAS